jgi:hypothetical protein
VVAREPHCSICCCAHRRAIAGARQDGRTPSEIRTARSCRTPGIIARRPARRTGAAAGGSRHIARRPSRVQAPRRIRGTSPAHSYRHAPLS